MESSIYLDILKEKLKNVKKAEVFVNSKEISKAVGNRRQNILALEKEGIIISIHGDDNLKKREVRCVCY